MTTEARLGFLLFFFLSWTIVALLPWAGAVVLSRGRGADWALPVAVVAGWAAGVIVPLAGFRDFTGFVISLFAAVAASAGASFAAITVCRRAEAERAAKAGDEVSGAPPAASPAEPTLDRPAPPSLD